jgi:hypothetical protein
MKTKLTAVIITIFTMIFIGCATAPQNKVWRPWTRVIETQTLIPVGSKIAVTAEGITEPMFGENKLQDKELSSKVENFLVRRGFEIDRSNYSYLIKFRFRTERRDKTLSANYTSAYNSNFYLNNYSGSNAVVSPYGLSAAIAQSVNALASETRSTTLNTTETVRYYTHSVIMEIFERNGNLNWTGESTWDSPNINFVADSDLALQLLIVNLPKDEKKIPSINKLQNGKVENYYSLNCRNYWYSSPALPYKIAFNNVYSPNMPTLKIKYPIYLPAYVDLLNTAEEAVPTGSSDYKRPLERGLWSNVILGGIYKDKKLGSEFKILITLIGNTNGYIVEKCWVASDSEYADYQNKLKIWKQALYDYYDVLEK